MRLSSSFRDPSGFMFRADGSLLRYVSLLYKDNYDKLLSSGLYEKLEAANLLISHQDVTKKHGKVDNRCYKILRPELVPFISYPYEWSFSQLKDAALTTLKIQKLALEHGMILKDASAYNIQFYGGEPLLIDTLSFDVYKEGQAWLAYQQFCHHFMGPLALAAYVDIRLLKLLRDYVDGIPLDLVSKLLPVKTRFKPQLYMHLHLHAKSQKKHAGRQKKVSATLSLKALNNLVDSLELVIKSLKWQPSGTQWADYYEDTNYSQTAFKSKLKIVEELISLSKPSVMWDMGANIGEFSRLASNKDVFTIAFDTDPAAVEKNYLQVKKNSESNLLPLTLDLANPSPPIGWANQERMSLSDRGSPDLVMALALIHHLAISNNVPLADIAKFFAGLTKHLIIEFVPKEDSQVKRLLLNRKNIFSNYSQKEFEKVFANYYKVVKSAKVSGSQRTIYLMKNLINLRNID
ncbi:MAG: hypothetical protein WD877_00480 [Candidatus Saccharimonadales bacterium]